MTTSAPIPTRAARVIGRPPPGVGGSPDIIPLGAPQFLQGGPTDWDVMEERLWVSSVTAAGIQPGQDRALARRLGGTAVFRAVSFRVTGTLAGYPVVTLTSRGWIATKTEHWSWTRQTQGDLEKFTLGGFAYVKRIRFFSTVVNATTPALAIPVNRFGLVNATVAPVYSSTWPYYLTGSTAGFYISSSEWEPLPASPQIGRSVFVFSCLMNKDGTAPT